MLKFGLYCNPSLPILSKHVLFKYTTLTSTGGYTKTPTFSKKVSRENLMLVVAGVLEPSDPDPDDEEIDNLEVTYVSVQKITSVVHKFRLEARRFMSYSK